MLPNGNQPIFIMPDGTQQTKGKSAQSGNIRAAKAVAEAVKSTLGPKGMDKMLVNGLGDVLITNDGATILREINVEHPAAKMVIAVSETQEAECYDGTTSAVVLAGALLGESEDLIEKNVHPTVIAAGYRMASQHALSVLKGVCQISDEDLGAVFGGDEHGTEYSLAINCAKTSLTGKFTDSSVFVKDRIADIAGKAVAILREEDTGEVNLDDLNIICASGGSVEDSYLMDGIVLEKEKAHIGMPTSIDNPKIALVSSAIQVRTTEVDARINITSPDQMQKFLDQEEKALKDIVNSFKKAGATFVMCQKEIDDLALHYMAREGIMAIAQCRKSQFASVSKSTGATIVDSVDDLLKTDLGNAGLVRERKIGENIMVEIGGIEDLNKALTVVLRGSTSHIVEEVERAFDDAVGVVSLMGSNSGVVAGGGSTYVEIAASIREFASTVKGRRQLAVMAFADALEVLPTTIAENAGLDPVDVIMELRAAHSISDNESKYYGVNIDDEGTGVLASNMLEKGVVEPLKVVEQALLSATETAVMILRIDDVIQMKQNGPPQM